MYETIIIAKPAHTMPKTLALKLLGVPSPIPEFNKTPHVNHSARDKFNASSSVLSVFDSLNLAKGLNLSSKYKTTATT